MGEALETILLIILPTIGFAMFIGTAIWVVINRDRTPKTFWWAVVGVVGMLLAIVLATQLLIG